MADPVFRFLIGEKVKHIIGMPGPDTDDCEVIADHGGEQVQIRFKVYGEGPTHEVWKHRDQIVWLKGSATAERYREHLHQHGPGNGEKHGG